MDFAHTLLSMRRREGLRLAIRRQQAFADAVRGRTEVDEQISTKLEETMKRSLILLAALPALLASTSIAAFAEDTITLGAAVQSTGSQANTGRYYADAYQLAVDTINAKGGVKVGDTTYKLALKLYDNQSDASLAVRQYTQLVTSDKVNFLLGPFASNFVLDTSSVAEKYEIPMVQGGGASGQIFSRDYKYIFGTLPPAGDYFSSTIEMLGKLDPKPASVALVAADDSFDVSVAKGTRKHLEDAGLNLVVDEKFADGNGEFSSILSLIKSKSPDVILWTGHETDALNFIRQMKSLDVNVKLYALTVGVPTADFRSALGDDANYAFGMTTWLPERAQTDQWFGNAARVRQGLQGQVRLRSGLSRRVRRGRRRDLRGRDCQCRLA